MLSVSLSQAQSLVVGTPFLEDYFRRKQLTGELDSTISFTVRPLHSGSFNSIGVNFADSLLRVGKMVHSTLPSTISFNLLPILWQQQYNSDPSYAWNDGSLIPAKGYQTRLSFGVYASAGPLSIQLRPEFIFAENKPFRVIRSHYSNADLPYRFGDKSYSKATWGQSSIRLTFDPVSFGISNENLWWGPGIKNSLLMSNTAAGFKHITLNTSRPIRTPVGHVEAQIVAGRLEKSGFGNLAPDKWRYLSGLVLSYQPKWVPGLFLGLTRSFQSYANDVDSFGDYFPLFTPFQKINDKNQSSLGTDARDQLTSLFARWAITESKAEIYFEYGLNDHSYNIRDFLMSPEHSRSYTIGLRKLVPFQKKDKFFQFDAEITRLEQSIDRIMRQAGEWYTHSPIVHGYTHSGEVLGAGIGPGGNSQIVDISVVDDFKNVGLTFMRYEHNGDLAYVYSYDPWIDFSVAAYTNWTFKNLLASTRIIGIQSISHQWMDGQKGRPKRNVFNINAQLGLIYSF